jgi:hypothetical protein
MQARIPDEMSVYSHQWDIKDIATRVKDAMGDGALLDQLFLFVSISTSPDPAVLVAEAEQSIRDHPLSSLFAAVHFDRDGKAFTALRRAASTRATVRRCASGSPRAKRSVGI